MWIGMNRNEYINQWLNKWISEEVKGKERKVLAEESNESKQRKEQMQEVEKEVEKLSSIIEAWSAWKREEYVSREELNMNGWIWRNKEIGNEEK